MKRVIVLPHFEDATIFKRRRLTFNEDNAAGTFFINCRRFNPRRVNEYVKLNTDEEWVLRNTSRELHPFHIHVNDFQVMSVNGRPQRAHGLQDTVPIPIGGRIVIRMRFRDFVGRYVFHCHILAHEDAGMMGIVDVTRTGRPPPGGPRDNRDMAMGGEHHHVTGG